MNQQQARATIEQFLKTVVATAFSDATPAQDRAPLSAVDFLEGKAASTQASPSNAAVQTAGRVAVRRPDGMPTTIPAVHLNAALQHGYKLMNQK